MKDWLLSILFSFLVLIITILIIGGLSYGLIYLFNKYGPFSILIFLVLFSSLINGTYDYLNNKN